MRFHVARCALHGAKATNRVIRPFCDLVRRFMRGFEQVAIGPRDQATGRRLRLVVNLFVVGTVEAESTGSA